MEKFNTVCTDSVSSITSSVPSRVLFTVPHDGARPTKFASLISPRKNGITRRDRGTWSITRGVLRFFSADVVVGHESRKYIDYNRACQEAFESSLMAHTYARYHGMISRWADQRRKIYPIEELLVIDMHSFPKDRPERMCDGYDLVLGTAHRKTILYGQPDRAFGEFMRARGYSVFIPDVKPARTDEPDNFSGGYTVRTVAKDWHINTLQIEISEPKFCTPNSALAGTKLSEDIGMCLSEYCGR